MEQKSFWSKLVESFKSLIPSWDKISELAQLYLPGAIKKYAPVIAAKVFGSAGGLQTWLVKLGLTKVWKEIKPWLIEKGYIAKAVKYTKEKLLPILEKNKQDIPVEEKIKNENDFLNGSSNKS